MTRWRRLYYHFDIHGGAQGAINLDAGNAHVADVLVPRGYLSFSVLFASAGVASWSLGTIDEPELLITKDLTSYSDTVGQLYNLNPSSWPYAVIGVESPWALWIYDADVTAGSFMARMELLRR